MAITVLRFAIVTLAAAFLSACVAGQSIDIRYQPNADDLKQFSDTGGNKAVEDASVAVQVTDDRAYVKNREKDPSYIGHYRAGFGNTWDVTTKGDRPLADVMSTDLGTELTDLGFTIAPRDRARNRIDVSIREWNFDTYINGKFWYRVDVSAEKTDGTVLSRKTLNDKIVIKGNIITGAKYAFEEEIPKIYNKVLRKIVRDDPDLFDKLRH